MSTRGCKLAAIYNVWDDSNELLLGSINCLKDHVDLFIIVYQDISNFGEAVVEKNRVWLLPNDEDRIIAAKYEPNIELGGQLNERIKRNLGLDLARINHCTHFLHIDSDEYYEDFGIIKNVYLQLGHAGSVLKMRTYFKKPTLVMFPPEDYYVPFIHKLKEDTKAGSSSYKFYVDPTRVINETDVIELPFLMHHFSWVRKDIMRKIRNSSAPIQQNKIALEDYENAKEGYFLKNWRRTLMTTEDKFNLSHIFEQP